MIEVQVLNKILETKDASILNKYGLTVEYFAGYENEFNFIAEHIETYGNVPDKATFIETFQEFDFVDVAESDEYLVHKIREQNGYYVGVPIVQTLANKLQEDSFQFFDYLHQQSDKYRTFSNNVIPSIDIIGQAEQRLEAYKNKKTAEKPYYIGTGFKELDDLIGGWQKEEEFVVFFARTGMGKSWVLVTSMTEAWKNGYRVGYISPEMSANKIGYRFDTVFAHLSNKALTRGHDVEGYEDYTKDLKTVPTPFLVATPKDFQKNITVSKLRAFCINNKLDILAIDGITYLKDERRQKGDNKTTMLTNISEDLMSLSVELKIPILTVVQSNRGGVQQSGEQGVPELENIRDSDGIAFNATKVISLRQDKGILQMSIKKHRDGEMGGSLDYNWNIDKGEYSFIGDGNTSQGLPPIPQKQQTKPMKREEKAYTDLF